jgi:hypothetical protein
MSNNWYNSPWGPYVVPGAGITHVKYPGGSTAVDPYLTESAQRFLCGQRCIDDDGRVFKYAYSREVIKPAYGAFNLFPVSKHITYAVLPAVTVAGQKKFLVTFPSTCGYANVGFAANELTGGYIVIGNNTATTTENRRISDNAVMGATTSTAYVTVDQPLFIAHAVTDGVEAYPNPYKYIGNTSSSSYAAVMGVPTSVSTASKWIWLQTWGPCWVTPGGADASPGDTASDRTAYFVGDGSVNFGTSLTVETGYQLAGFCIDTTASGTSAMPLIMLQISI